MLWFVQYLWAEAAPARSSVVHGHILGWVPSGLRTAWMHPLTHSHGASNVWLVEFLWCITVARSSCCFSQQRPQLPVPHQLPDVDHGAAFARVHVSLSCLAKFCAHTSQLDNASESLRLFMFFNRMHESWTVISSILRYLSHFPALVLAVVGRTSTPHNSLSLDLIFFSSKDVCL